MYKKLVFFCYITRNIDIDDYVYHIHFNCVKRYEDNFDKMLFVLSADDVNDIELIEKFKLRLVRLNCRSIEFRIEQNTELRESKTFKEEIIDKIGESNELIFFAHTKGLSNGKYKRDNIGKWIASMYYFSLKDNIDKLMVQLPGIVLYGFPIVKYTYNAYEIPKSKLRCEGSIFWVNMGNLNNRIRGKNIDVLCSDRYFSEMCLPNILEDNAILCYKMKALINAENLYETFEDYIKIFCNEVGENEYDNFMKFYNEVKQ